MEEENKEIIRIGKEGVKMIALVIISLLLLVGMILVGIALNNETIKKTTSKVQNETTQLCQQQFINFQNSINQQLLTTGKITVKIGEQQINLVPER